MSEYYSCTLAVINGLTLRICISKVAEYAAKLRRDADTKNTECRMLSLCVDHRALCEARENANYRELPRGTVREILIGLGNAFSQEGTCVANLVLSKADYILNGHWKYPKITARGFNFSDAYMSRLPPYLGEDPRDERQSSGIYRTVIPTERTANVGITTATTQSTEGHRNKGDVPQVTEALIIDQVAPKQRQKKGNVNPVVSKVKNSAKRKVVSQTEIPNSNSLRPVKKSKNSNATIPDDAQYGPWAALANPFIGLANFGSEGAEKRPLSSLPHQAMFAWDKTVCHDNKAIL